MLNISPKGTVPVLLLSGAKVIEESLDIMLWALKTTPSHPWKEFSDVQFSEQLAFIERSDTEFKGHLDNYKYRSSEEQDEGLQPRELAMPFLLELERRLENSPWLFGANQSLCDFAIAPFVRQFANVDRQWFDGQAWPRLIQWLDIFLRSSEFLSVMTKYKQWAPEDEPVFFPTSP